MVQILTPLRFLTFGLPLQIEPPSRFDMAEAWKRGTGMAIGHRLRCYLRATAGILYFYLQISDIKVLFEVHSRLI